MDFIASLFSNSSSSPLSRLVNYYYDNEEDPKEEQLLQPTQSIDIESNREPQVSSTTKICSGLMGALKVMTATAVPVFVGGAVEFVGHYALTNFFAIEDGNLPQMLGATAAAGVASYLSPNWC